MNSLYNYIYAILMFVVLITLLEMILPKGNNRKYVKLVSGFLLTFVVLTPIINIFASDSQIKEKIEDGLSQIDMNSSSIETINQQVYIDNLFEEGIKNDISSIIESMGYIAGDVEIKYNKNEEGEFTNITKIDIDVIDKKEYDNIKNIEKVSVNIDDNKTNEWSDSSNKIALNDIDKQNILDCISDKYKVDKSCINID